MIKILVNNEEVVSDSNLQINEEMLSTSSTILKNCYPKSWENDKDYTSRYYFPKDYSKCKIYDSDDIEQGITVIGNDLNVNYEDDKFWEYKILGNSNKVTGMETITINNNEYNINLGKNLWNTPAIPTTTWNVTLEESNSNSIKISASQSGYFVGYIEYDITNMLEPNTTYTISKTNITTGDIFPGEGSLRLRVNGIYGQTLNVDELTFTTPNTINSFSILFYIAFGNVTGGTGTLTLNNIQLEEGSNATPYVDYFSPIILNENDFIYKRNDNWYVKINNTNKQITNITLLNQLNAVELENGENDIQVSKGTIELHYNFSDLSSHLIFCGCVKNTGKISLNPRQPHFVDLQLLDFKCLLSEGETLDFVISNKTIVEAINQVVASISDYGFVVGNIEVLNPNDVINAYSTLNKTPYDVFQYIADITQSRWSTRMIDENIIAIDFYDPTLMPKASDINHTEEYFEENKINSIDFNYSTNDYRNKQIMTSDEVYANITQTETVIANGYQDSFMCQNKIGKITEITINGVSATFITKNEKELGLNGDFIYNPGEITFTSTNILNAGDVIVIIYYPIVKGREIILNSNEISRINNQINRKGTISRYESRKDATSSQELQKIGQSYIKYKGSAEITLKIVSENELFDIGQIVSYNAPLEELTTDYMVKKKTIDMYLNADKIFYTFELSSNFNYENAVNYFDNQRAKNQGNIGEGETIIRNIDLESTALIQFYDTNVEEIQIVETTSLDFGLDGVLI